MKKRNHIHFPINHYGISFADTGYMKTLKKILIALFLFTATEIISSQKSFAQVSVGVSMQVFYDNLSPYGTWIDYPNYGYVWMPIGLEGFSPYYSNGYWSYADVGWTWVSDYPWGWAPFHYGRWMLDPFYGWVWVPDYYWAPSWVVWRSGGGYCGWAAMAPGMNVSITSYNIPREQWVFVDQKYMGNKNISTYYGPRSSNEKYFSNTSVEKNTFNGKNRNTTYFAGPNKEVIEKASGKTISPMTIKESEKPGQKVSGNELAIYRPVVKPNTRDEKKPAPSKVVNYKSNPKEMKPEKAATEKSKEPAPEKNLPAKKDKLPKSEPPSALPKKMPEHQPKQEPPKENPHREIPPAPKPERPQMMPPKNPQPVFPQPMPRAPRHNPHG